jgi:hypothetical protein
MSSVAAASANKRCSFGNGGAEEDQPERSLVDEARQLAQHHVEALELAYGHQRTTVGGVLPRP